ncbi:hypothetical protein [Streptomyces sp. NPDC059009]|uniref:hypothetical protein n=1 Tax=Streptomyces sp. NPDC059009 TaxID=3346694 RepID=UPI003673E890
MSQEAVPEQGAAHDSPVPSMASAPEQEGRPKGLLQQMEELMAALNADLTQLDADLQQSAATPSSTALPQSPDSRPPASGDEPGRS